MSMKVRLFITAALLSLAGAAHAQTAPATPPASDLTRDLNSGPPVPAAYIAPTPAPVVTPAPTTAAPSAAASPTAAAPFTRSGPATSPSVTSSGPTAEPPIMTPPEATPVLATPAPQPRAGPVTPPNSTSAPTSAPVAAPEPAPSPPPPNVSAVIVLDTAARAALPFTVSLPPGFEIVTGRPGPDFRIYTIRRGDQSFVMVYAGPASQFPIYSGQMVEAGGRASVVSTETGVRHAMEHLFQRPDAPREIHVWTMSLDGADRAMAEGIAQSVDLR
ncbi:MAG: hypothetical protein PSV23_04420 [Brevundimonas sp.]|uniref:hypothetical protein n=1 Tax=Brevundimonas sp. TaxID=1871086 RepID=UPI002488D1CE|nr:hypothetical protein [Brevundimonas sp.]MDI1326027.1 hypothetical protein [Brevundimonas sp.]